jgi:hypothetical protein
MDRLGIHTNLSSRIKRGYREYCADALVKNVYSIIKNLISVQKVFSLLFVIAVSHTNPSFGQDENRCNDKNTDYCISQQRPDYPIGADKVDLPLKRIIILNGDSGRGLSREDILSAPVYIGSRNKNSEDKIINGSLDRVESVDSFFQNFTNKNNDFKLVDLYLIKDAVARKLNEKGLILSYPVIPPQKIDLGSERGAVACIGIISGQLDLGKKEQEEKVIIEDKNKRENKLWMKSNEELIESIMKKAINKINTENNDNKSIKDIFEDSILRINDIPGNIVDSVFIPANPSLYVRDNTEKACADALKHTENTGSEKIIVYDIKQVKNIIDLQTKKQARQPDDSSDQKSNILSADSIYVRAVTDDYSLNIYTGIDSRNGGYVGKWAVESGAEANFRGLSDFIVGERVEAKYKIGLLESRVKSWEAVADIWIRPGESDPLRISIMRAHSSSRPGQALREMNLYNITDTTALYGTYGLERGRERNITFRAGIEAIDTTSTVMKNQFVRDRLRVVRGGVTYDSAHFLTDIGLGEFAHRNLLFLPTPAFMADVEVSRGLKGLGSTSKGSIYSSRESGESNFTKVKFILGSVANILTEWTICDRQCSFYFSASGQYAFDPLLVAEQFGLGGRDFGRGFLPSAYTGDHGLAGVIEFRRSFNPDWLWTREVQPYAFIDSGRVWQFKQDTGLPGVTATSWGAGVRSNTEFGDSYGYLKQVGLSMDAQVAGAAAALTTKSANRDGWSVNFIAALRARF